MSGTLVASTINAGASAALLLQSNNTTALTLDTSQNVTAAGTVAMASSFKRNRIINGNMAIDQRNAGAQITPITGNYTVDRWAYLASQASKFTAQQNAGSVTTAAGFSNYLGMTVASAVSVGASDYFCVSQPIEGFNFADLNFGTANAKTITVSCVVYSSLTGTFGGCLINYLGTRSYTFTYTIASANTWTTVSVTIPGDTSGTWVGASNAGAASLRFSMGAGSSFSGTAGAWGAGNLVSATGAVSVVGTASATFYVTGVQLEVGTKATPYEMQIYNDQLAQCQRYYCKTVSPVYGGYYTTVDFSVTNWVFKVEMRASPSIVYAAGSVYQTVVSVATDSVAVSNQANSAPKIATASTASAEL